MSQRHRIRRQVLEIAIPHGQQAQALQEQLSRIQTQHLAAVIDRCLSEMVGPNQICRIDSLQIDLGKIDLRNLERDLPRKLEKALRAALQKRWREDAELSAMTHEDPEAQSRLELLAYFAQHGSLPWWVDAEAPKIVNKSLALSVRRAPRALAALIRGSARERGKLMRIVLHCDDERLGALFDVLMNPAPPGAKEILKSLLKTAGKLSFAQSYSWRTSLWMGILRAAAIEVRGNDAQHKFWQSALAEAALEVEQTYESLLDALHVFCEARADAAEVQPLRAVIFKLHPQFQIPTERSEEKSEAEQAIDAQRMDEVRRILEQVLAESESEESQHEESQHEESQHEESQHEESQRNAVELDPVREQSEVAEAEFKSPEEIPDVVGSQIADKSNSVQQAAVQRAASAHGSITSDVAKSEALASEIIASKSSESEVLAHEVSASEVFAGVVSESEATADELRAQEVFSNVAIASEPAANESIANESIAIESIANEIIEGRSNELFSDDEIGKKPVVHDIHLVNEFADLSFTKQIPSPSPIQALAPTTQPDPELISILGELCQLAPLLAPIFVGLRMRTAHIDAKHLPMLRTSAQRLLRIFTSENLGLVAPELEPGVQRELVNLLKTGVLSRGVLRHCLTELRRPQEATATTTAATETTAATTKTETAEEVAVARQQARRRAMLEKSMAAMARSLPIDLRHSDADAVYVENAGLVILWPFLPSLFERLGLTVENQFVDRPAMHRAVGLLLHLANGEVEPQEYDLVLFKIMCGMELTEIFRFGDAVTDVEAAECGDLLTAAMLHGKIFGEMTFAEFRQAFLLRKGALTTRDGLYLLRVERAEGDAVLLQLPWSTSWVKLPWLASPLQVEW